MASVSVFHPARFDPGSHSNVDFLLIFTTFVLMLAELLWPPRYNRDTVHRREQEGRPCEAVTSGICPASQQAGGGGARSGPTVTCCVLMTAVRLPPSLLLQTQTRGGASAHARRQTAALFKLHFAIFFCFKHANGQLAVIFFTRRRATEELWPHTPIRLCCLLMLGVPKCEVSLFLALPRHVSAVGQADRQHGVLTGSCQFPLQHQLFATLEISRKKSPVVLLNSGLAVAPTLLESQRKPEAMELKKKNVISVLGRPRVSVPSFY